MIVSKNDEAWNALFDKYQIGNKIERNVRGAKPNV